jgi:LPS-assembly protein
MDAELVNFVKATTTTAPTGTRIDLTPSVALPLEGPAWFLTPRLALRYTEYQLEDAEEPAMRRSLPVASLDSGLFFERDLAVGQTPLLQTLEPRLFYLYVPFEAQDELPLFDTSAYDFTMGQLFRTNRFSGVDRVGDANQLTTALTSRLLNAESGRELASAGIGQIHYFRDREVTLQPGAAAEETQSSDIVAELSASPVEGLEFNADTRWNPHDEVRERLNARVRFRPAPGKAVALSYRQDDPVLEQTDLAFYWPVARHWNLLGRWNYDLLTEQDLDTIVGVEYQDCCWALRLLRRTTLNTSTLELDRSILITLELKGLAHIGRRLDEEVERGILGYE